MKILFFFFMLISTLLHCQINPVQIGTLPALISESSGLQMSTTNRYWTHNDNSDDERLYVVSSNGTFLGQIFLSGVDQVDYEDITSDDQNNFYVGDFGNNNNQRTDLKVYKLDNPEDVVPGSTTPETIEFILEDQVLFPPSDPDLNFDIESMVHYNGVLNLFTRNRSIPYTGITKWYQLNDQVGSHTATLEGTFNGNLSELFSAITGADISTDGNRLALLTRGSVYIFTQPISGDFFQGTSTYNFFTFNSNFEGITFKDECTVVISEESQGMDHGRIFQLNTCEIVTDVSEYNMSNSLTVSIVDNILRINTTVDQENFEVIISDTMGRTLKHVSSKTRIDISNLSPGLLVITLFNNVSSHSARILKFQ